MIFKPKHDAIAHITLLILVQWISMSVIVLNAIAVNAMSNSFMGLINATPGAQDYLLIVLGAVSFLSSSLLLCLHLHVFLQLIDNRPFAPSRTILATEMIIGVILIGLLASVTSTILTNYSVSSPCRANNNSAEFLEVYGQVCDLISNSITLGFSAGGGWLLVILTTLYTLSCSSIHASATIFTVESPTYVKKHTTTTLALVTCSKLSTESSMSFHQQELTCPSPAVVTMLQKPINSMNDDCHLYYEGNNQLFPQAYINGSRSIREQITSWCSEYSTATTAADNDDVFYRKTSMEPIALGDLPCIEEGMSNMNLSFFAQPDEGKQERKTNCLTSSIPNKNLSH